MFLIVSRQASFGSRGTFILQKVTELPDRRGIANPPGISRDFHRYLWTQSTVPRPPPFLPSPSVQSLSNLSGRYSSILTLFEIHNSTGLVWAGMTRSIVFFALSKIHRKHRLASGNAWSVSFAMRRNFWLPSIEIFICVSKIFRSRFRSIHCKGSA